MADFDWKSIVRTVAPSIATALGSPLAGAAVRVLSDTFLGKTDGTEQELEAAINGATPEQLLMLKKADQDFAVQMKSLDIKLEETYIKDTNDARVAHSGNTNVFWLGVAVLITFAFTIGAVLLSAHQILTGGISINDPSMVAVVFTLIGTLVGYVAANAQQVISYFFGSSAGSKEKTNAMALAVQELGKK